MHPYGILIAPRRQLPGNASIEPFRIFYDDFRHDKLGANRLWLDMHVSRDLPRGTPYHVDPWWVPGKYGNGNLLREAGFPRHRPR